MSSLTTRPLPGTQRDPLYPDSDGRPMGETDFHSFALILLRECLQDFFAEVPDVYVASNIVLYFEQGNPSGHRDPDILVAKGVGKHFRRSFRVWEENTMPRVHFEITSESTWREDVGNKRALYERLGVGEYFLFDPEAAFLDPPLQGFRLENGVFVAIPPAADGSLISQELGLRLVPEGPMLRLFDLRTGKPVLTRSELAEQQRERAEKQKQQTKKEKQRAQEEKQRAEQEKQRAEQEKQRAEQEKQRAEQEKQRAEQMEKEVERLRALLERFQEPGK